MKTLCNFLSGVGIFLLMTILMASGCHKEPIIPPVETKPVIKSFIVASATMSSATFTFSAENYSALSISIDGGSPISVSGGSYTATGLTSGKSYSAVLIASGQGKEVKSSQSFSTSKSTLSAEFKLADSTATGASFTFTTAGNATTTSQSLTNVNTGEVIDVMSKTTHTVNNLTPNTQYTFTFKVKDNTGNEVSQSITFKTKEKVSEWFSIVSVTYGEQFAIIGNAVSSKLTIKVNNSAATPKDLDYLISNLGEYGIAVKMLRYSLNGGSWVRCVADNAGAIAFTNLTFQPGDNTFECYFALKPNVGVPNNSPLSFSITRLRDKDGATSPKGGSFPVAVAVGSVNAVVQPTVITSNILGYMYVSPVAYSPQSAGTTNGFYQIIALKAAGPAGTRLTNVRLKNPYASVFSSMIFGYQNIWSIRKGFDGGIQVKSFFWQSEFINLALSDENNSITTDGANNDYYFSCGAKNNSQEDFYSGAYTPGRMGFVLTSKYDVIITNSSGQTVDLSDVVVKHEDVVLQN